MITKGATYDPFFRIKSSKKAINETKTTLDTLHNSQIQQMRENESGLQSLVEERKELEEIIKQGSSNKQGVESSTPQNYDQLESRVKTLNNEIDIRKDKNEFLDYFLDTGDLLYKYYDIQEQIQDGMLPLKQISESFACSQFGR